MDKNYSIKLANGLVLKNLTLNGNNYISKEEVKASIFSRNCSPVIINDGIMDEVHEHMELIHINFVNGEYWIALRDISESELTIKKKRADIDYIAMMTDVDI